MDETTSEYLGNLRAKEANIDATKIDIAACKYLKQQFSAMRTKIKKRRDETVDEKIQHVKELLGEYATPEEAHEAYGYDYITEDEYDELKNAFENGTAEAEADDIDSITIEWLNDFIRRLSDNINIGEYELLSPEEKLKRDKRIAEFNAEHEARRKHIKK